MSVIERPVLHVCLTCKADQVCEGDQERPGQHVYRALEHLIAEADAAAAIDLRPVSCLASCDRGCAATIFMPGKFGYLLGGLTPAHAADLLAYAGAYAASPTGVVLPSRRAPSLRHAILGRFPPPYPVPDGRTPGAQAPNPQPKARS